MHPKRRSDLLIGSSLSAQASTILARNASACELFARRAHRCSVARSPSVSFSSAFGRPVLAMPQPCPDIARAGAPCL